MERLQFGIKLRNILEIRSNRLIDKVIRNDHWLILIVLCNTLPDVAEKLLGSLTLEEPRIAVAVIDIVSCLSSRGIMHVKYYIETMRTAPADHVIQSLETILIRRQTHIILVCEEFVVEWYTDGIRSLGSDELDILLGHIVVLEHLPELCSKVRADHLLEHLVDHPCRVGLLETEHISLRIKPVTEVCSLDEKGITVRLDQILAAYTDERFLWKVLLLRCA